MTEDNITIGVYLNAKLGINMDQFCGLESESDNTLYKRWNTVNGKQRIKDRVQCLWMGLHTPHAIKRFNAL